MHVSKHQCSLNTYLISLIFAWRIQDIVPWCKANPRFFEQGCFVIIIFHAKRFLWCHRWAQWNTIRCQTFKGYLRLPRAKQSVVWLLDFHRQPVQVPALQDPLGLCLMCFLLSFPTSCASCIQVAFWRVSLVVFPRWSRHSQQAVVFLVDSYRGGVGAFQIRQYISSQFPLIPCHLFTLVISPYFYPPKHYVDNKR